MATNILKQVLRAIPLIAFFGLGLLAPSTALAGAEQLTVTKITVKLNITGIAFSNNTNPSNYTIAIKKGTTRNYSTMDSVYSSGSYMIFEKTISRCSSSYVDDDGWTISIIGAAGGARIISNLSLCGNPIFVIQQEGGFTRPAEGACSFCPTTKVVTGVLKHITGAGTSPEDRVYYIDRSSGNSLQLGTNAAKWRWSAGTYNVGSTYTCDYTGTLATPYYVACKVGTTSPNNKQPTPATEADAEADTATPSDDEKDAPLTIGFSGDGIDKVSIDDTRCPTKADGTKSTTYTSGILKGVPCAGAIKTLDDALILVKNVIMTFLLPLVGTLFLIMLIIGGILYITSRGNQQQLEKAKKTLTAAIIGLIIVTLSYTIIVIFAKVICGGIT
jgi:hypothetical protein